ncbi:MAG: hypothetical protein P8188_19440, partial [Gemmatimonadota bacterium]
HQALKVTSIRNPWDILVSAWQWRRDGRGGRAEPIEAGFREWASSALSRDPEWQERCGAYDARKLMHPFIFIDGVMSVDYLIRQEAIDDGLEWISARTGLPLGRIEVREKTSRREGGYRTYYDDDLAARVREYFEDIIEVSGYRF